MKLRSIIPPFVIISGFVSILSILWEEEFKHYQTLGASSELAADAATKVDFIIPGKPSYLHFFSEDCRNARINISHIPRIIASHEEDVLFYLVNNSSMHSSKLREKYDVPPNVRIIDDARGQWARKLQVKTSPYALILDDARNLYFGGNYNNQNGLCGSSEIIWSSPAVALRFLTDGKPAPLFPGHQVNFIGCTIEN